MTILPPNVSAAQFASAMSAFEAAVGKEWVLSSDMDIAAYRDPWSMVRDKPGELLPSAAVAPASVEEVQAVVRVANQFKIPLYTVSTGKNYSYGGAAPNVRGSVIVDLKRMKQIIEIDGDRNFALVEPGVTYFDLYREIQARGLKLMIDNPDPAWGSPSGNSLDRGVGYTMGPYRDHASSVCGIEVVLASGEVMRTGMGALPGSKSWQEYKHGFGPDPAGLFFQGNYGIVTKVGVRLMPMPEHYRTGKITVPRRRDLHGLIKTVNYLADMFMVGEPVFSSPLHPLMKNKEFADEATRYGKFNDDRLDEMAAEANLPFYQVELQFYGSEATTRANWEYAQEIARRNVPESKALDGVSYSMPLTREQIMDKSPPYGESAIRRYAAVAVPNLTTFDYVGRHVENPDDYVHLHYGMFTVVPRSAEAVFEVQRAWVDLVHDAKATLVTEQTPRPSALTLPMQWHQTCFFMWAGFPLQTTKRPISEALLDMLERVLEVNAQHGWSEYRSEPMLQDKVAAHYNFNDFALRRFNETIKDAVDPNGILSPGRGGIWPKAFRSMRGKVGL